MSNERIAKRIARTGLCSRRDAERLIAEGRVTVNDRRIDSPALNVTTKDRILVDGNPLADAEPTQLWLYHKPAGQMTTRRDPQGRPTVFDGLPPSLPPHVMAAGRLDYNTEGLLLLTNDGDLARYVTQPSTGWTRRYRIRVFGTPSEQTLAALRRGVTLGGIRYRGMEVTVDKPSTNSWLTIALTEGKNREIRKLFAEFGHPVSRIIRIAYGPFQLGNLPQGGIRKASTAALRGALGKGWASHHATSRRKS